MSPPPTLLLEALPGHLGKCQLVHNWTFHLRGHASRLLALQAPLQWTAVSVRPGVPGGILGVGVLGKAVVFVWFHLHFKMSCQSPPPSAPQL